MHASTANSASAEMAARVEARGGELRGRSFDELAALPVSDGNPGNPRREDLYLRIKSPVAAPCSQLIACSPVRNGHRGRPLNRIVSQHGKGLGAPTAGC